ncbi:MAG: CheR family methyltransferase [Desulfurivibrionaceae bacterium]
MGISGPQAMDIPAGVADNLLARFSDFVAAHTGLHFPRKQWRALERGMACAAREFGFEDPEACLRWIMASPLSREQIEILARHLTVGETYFLREKRSLEVFEEEIVPELIRTRQGDERHLRIWCAGCSTGEEPFSVAILLTAMGAALRDWHISIIGTDINPHALGRGAEGVYGEWSFRNPPQGFRDTYFRRTGDGRFEILPQIRKMVSFSYLNLAEDVYPSLLNNTNAMDVIFCRNVLMYFTPDRARMVVERLHRSLVDGGWLIVSPCEASQFLFSRFKAISFPDAILYRKEGAGVEGQGAVPRDRGPAEAGQFVPAPLPADSQSPPPLLRAPIFCSPPPAPRPPSPYEAALALYERGCYPEAEEKLAVLLAVNREDVEAAVLQCRVYANQGKLTEARELLEQAIGVDRLKAGLHYLRAMILQEQGAADEAVVSLKRALYLDQDLVLAHFSLGNLALRQGKMKEARKHFANTLSLLDRYDPADILPESEGLSAGRLREIMRTTAVSA